MADERKGIPFHFRYLSDWLLTPSSDFPSQRWTELNGSRKRRNKEPENMILYFESGSCRCKRNWATTLGFWFSPSHLLMAWSQSWIHLTVADILSVSGSRAFFREWESVKRINWFLSSDLPFTFSFTFCLLIKFEKGSRTRNRHLNHLNFTLISLPFENDTITPIFLSSLLCTLNPYLVIHLRPCLTRKMRKALDLSAVQVSSFVPSFTPRQGFPLRPLFKDEMMVSFSLSAEPGKPRFKVSVTRS